MSRSQQRIPKLRSRGRANRQRMLRRAEEMLAENNGSPLRFSDVFESAGVSRGSAYRIYYGIDDLMHDLAAEWLNNFVGYLNGRQPERPPPTWNALSDFIIECGADYWAETENTLKVMPRIRTNAPDSYRQTVAELSACLAELFDRYFLVPEIEGWHRKLAFCTQLCDISFSEAVRVDGKIGAERLGEAQALCRTYLGFHLPARLPQR